MEHDPTANQSDRKLRQKQNQLGNENQRNESQIVVADTVVYQRLSKERENHLQQASGKHPQP